MSPPQSPRNQTGGASGSGDNGHGHHHGHGQGGDAHGGPGLNPWKAHAVPKGRGHLRVNTRDLRGGRGHVREHRGIRGQIENPNILMRWAPSTSSLASGLVVPIPTLPVELI